MLAIISDLHLCDGTATEENVSPDAFGLFLQDLYGYARDYRAKSLDILYLGDIFDLIRTTAWLEAPPAERPWGSAAALGTATPEPKVLARALDIARKVK